MDARLKGLMEMDKTNIMDLERIALFSIISGNEDLYEKRSFIYDFEKRQINPECINPEEGNTSAVDFCGSS